MSRDPPPGPTGAAAKDLKSRNAPRSARSFPAENHGDDEHGVKASSRVTRSK